MLCGSRFAGILQSQHLYGSVPGAFQDNAVVGGEVWLCLKFGHHHLWTQWFTSQENGLEEFNHFIGLKQNVWHTTESSLLSLCHLT